MKLKDGTWEPRLAVQAHAPTASSPQHGLDLGLVHGSHSEWFIIFDDSFST